jgi:hypothetical protein
MASSMVAKITQRFGVITTLFGVLFVAFQYFDAKWKSRIERSLEYTVLYQEAEKISARNLADLWPLRASALGESNIDVAQLVEDAEDYLRTQSTLALGSTKVQDSAKEIDPIDQRYSSFTLAGLIGEDVAERIVEVAKGNLTLPSWPDLVDDEECRNAINAYVDQELDSQASRYKDIWRWQIGTDRGLLTEWGTLRQIDKERYYFDGSDAHYYYAWPYFTRSFLYADDIKNRESCDDAISGYEAQLITFSSDMLHSIHELKHFYAAVAICAISGLCDSLVACEIFNADIDNFVRKWRRYFELWSSRAREAEYWRLQEFVSHCFSNPLFADYSERRLTWYYGAPMLYVRNFTNFWRWPG